MKSDSKVINVSCNLCAQCIIVRPLLVRHLLHDRLLCMKEYAWPPVVGVGLKQVHFEQLFRTLKLAGANSGMINTYSMKQSHLYYFEAIKIT